MAVLQNFVRKSEAFNPSLKLHRKHYANFLKNGTWGKCPVAFYIPDSEESNTNMLFAMQRMLTEYYTEREFTNVAE